MPFNFILLIKLVITICTFVFLFLPWVGGGRRVVETAHAINTRPLFLPLPPVVLIIFATIIVRLILLQDSEQSSKIPGSGPGYHFPRTTINSEKNFEKQPPMGSCPHPHR